ncbi:MAG: hypothetical protein ACD_8C00066G0001 [uncultured bacterium]|nr:MAG: hypothetical protein ACD_8C00066G0001 [uncultured bacterium]
MDLEFDFNKNSSNFLSKAGDFWQKKYKFFLLLLLVVLVSVGGYVWRNAIYGQVWTDEKKQEYMDSKSKSVILKESNFKKASEDFESRKREIDLNPEEFRDVFKAY